MAARRRGLWLRFLPSALLMVAVALLFAPLKASCSTSVFGDVPGHWAEPFIADMAARGILTGYPDGTFGPDDSIRRREFAAVLARARGLQALASDPQRFSDVGTGDWAYGSVQALVAAGILRPADYDGALHPEAPITRVEIAVMLVRAAGLESEASKRSSLTTFSDAIPDWAAGYVTVAVNHGLVTGYEDATFRPNGNATRAEAGLMVLRMLDPKVRPATWVERYTYPGKSGTNVLKVVRVNFNRDDVQIRPATPATLQDNASLEDIAAKEGAVAAINGGYFSAYSDAQGDFREPYNALAIDGQWVHFQYQGTVLGITQDKRIIMDPIRMAIEGSTNGQAGAWTAWSMNHTSPDIIGIFTRYRGKTTGMADGITFTVENGRITSQGGPDVPIPENGYVIFVSNSRVNKWTADMFPIGARLDFKVNFYDHLDRPYGKAFEWERVVHAIGCGPRLVTGGAVTVNPQAEGYTEAKQTTQAYNRSGVGVTSDNIVMLVTCSSLTPQEFGEAMADLGSLNAMQMDSGASSCLWYNGGYLTEPGRMISNALLVTQR